ncbi:MAG: S41 family peptidase [Planctomycetota bacterium]
MSRISALVLALSLVSSTFLCADDSRRSLDSWIKDLKHPELSRREAATRRLIAAGTKARSRLRLLLRDADPALSARARRIFAAIHGTSSANRDKVLGFIYELRDEKRSPVSAAHAIGELGEGAQRLAIAELEGATSSREKRLRVELSVRTALARLERGEDKGDHAYDAIPRHGTSAAAPLLSVLSERAGSRDRRLHALWLYSLVAGSDRASGLATYLRDSDSVVRNEAVVSVSESLTSDSFSTVASALGDVASPERRAVAMAAARRMTIEQIGSHLGRRSSTACLAAEALGYVRSEDAYERLEKAWKGKPRSGRVREAIAVALGEFAGDKASDLLADVYASDSDPTVRAAAVASLRGRVSNRRAQVSLTAALLDTDVSVRLSATDALVGSSDQAFAPALIRSVLGDGDSVVKARALSGLESLVPDGPQQASVSEGDWENVRESWGRWLSERTKTSTESAPWFESSGDAGRIIRGVRGYVSSSFFYFDKDELVEEKNLNKAAFSGMRGVLKNKDKSKLSDFERRVVQRVISGRGDGGMSPEVFLSCLGTIPFESETSELVRLTDAAVRGMVGSLGDRFSRVMQSNDAEGKVRPNWVPGLVDNAGKSNGFSASKKGDTYVVDFVLYDSSAYYAGIQAGDQLIKVGDKFTSEMSSRDVGKAFGEEGEFSFLREGWSRPHAFRLVPNDRAGRNNVVKALLPGKIGVLRLKAFEAGCSVKLDQALVELENQGMKGLVFDLRNNPGGTVVDATEIVDKFLPEGKLITSTETRDGDDEVRATDSETDREYPVVVLVNRSSASAAEMTSGSLQGNDRAIVLGETSFGKGIGQSSRSFGGFASESALGTSRSVYVVALTMMRYYVPEGKRSVHLVGVEPDQPVLERQLKGSLFEKVMKVRKGKAFKSYVETLLKDHRDAMLKLAVSDARDTSRYPEFDAFYKKVKRSVSSSEARRIVRAEVRRRLILDSDDETFLKIFYDIQDDRTLRAALGEVAQQAEIDLGELEEYQAIGIR